MCFVLLHSLWWRAQQGSKQHCLLLWLQLMAGTPQGSVFRGIGRRALEHHSSSSQAPSTHLNQRNLPRLDADTYSRNHHGTNSINSRSNSLACLGAGENTCVRQEQHCSSWQHELHPHAAEPRFHRPHASRGHSRACRSLLRLGGPGGGSQHSSVAEHSSSSYSGASGLSRPLQQCANWISRQRVQPRARSRPSSLVHQPWTR